MTLRTDVDRAAARERLAPLNGGDVPSRPVEHAEIAQLRQLDRLPWLLAGFLVAIALLAVGNLLIVSVRRRARDLAVVRALGCTPHQVDGIVAWEATLLTIAGTIVGAPFGILLGRLVWERVARAYGVAADPSWPWFVVIVVIAATLVLVNAIAWSAARQAANRPIVRFLRAD